MWRRCARRPRDARAKATSELRGAGQREACVPPRAAVHGRTGEAAEASRHSVRRGRATTRAPSLPRSLQAHSWTLAAQHLRRPVGNIGCDPALGLAPYSLSLPRALSILSRARSLSLSLPRARRSRPPQHDARTLSTASTHSHSVRQWSPRPRWPWPHAPSIPPPSPPRADPVRGLHAPSPPAATHPPTLDGTAPARQRVGLLRASAPPSASTRVRASTRAAPRLRAPPRTSTRLHAPPRASTRLRAPPLARSLSRCLGREPLRSGDAR